MGVSWYNDEDEDGLVEVGCEDGAPKAVDVNLTSLLQTLSRSEDVQILPFTGEEIRDPLQV